MKGISVAVAVAGIGLLLIWIATRDLASPPSAPIEEVATTDPAPSRDTDAHLAESDGRGSSAEQPVASRIQERVFTNVDPARLTDADLAETLQKRPYKQYRLVTVNTNLLREKIRGAASNATFTIELFNDPITLVTEQGREQSDGWQAGMATWMGKMVDRQWSYCAIVIDSNGLIRASFQSEDVGLVTVEAVGEAGYHLMWSMDDNKIEDKGNDTAFLDSRSDES